MSIIDKAVNRLAEAVKNGRFGRSLVDSVKRELEKVPQWLGETADAQQYDMPDPSVYASQADMFRLSLPLSTALRVVGRDFGMMKINVKRMVGEDERDVKNQSLRGCYANPTRSTVDTSSSVIPSSKD